MSSSVSDAVRVTKAHRWREVRLQVMRVGLFVTCLVDLIRPSVGFAAVKLLEDAGCTVEVPPQSCCGQPAFNSGDRATARDIAEQVIKAFDLCDFVVAASGSCAGMLKPDIVYFGESVPKAVVEQAFSLIDAADALLVTGSSLTVFSGYRLVRHAAARGIPVAIVNRGPTRGDDLATVKVDGSCSELLTLLADELSTCRVWA